MRTLAVGIACAVTCSAVANAWESQEIRARRNGYALLEDRWQGFVRIKNKTPQREHLTCKLRVEDADNNLLGKGWTEPVAVPALRWRTASLIIDRPNIDQDYDHWRIRRCSVVSTKVEARTLPRLAWLRPKEVVPKPEPVETIPVESAPEPAQTTGVDWYAIAECESGGNWAENTGTIYDGGLQFHPDTWLGYGGGEYASEAWMASPAQQIAIAERVLASQGGGAWPNCFGAGL